MKPFRWSVRIFSWFYVGFSDLSAVGARKVELCRVAVPIFLLSLYGAIFSVKGSDVQDLGRIVMANDGGTAREGRLPFGVAAVSGGRLRTVKRGRLLSTLSLRMPKVFISRHGVLKFNIDGKKTKMAGVQNMKGMHTGTILVVVSKRPRFTNVCSRRVTSFCRARCIRQIRVLHNTNSILCNSGTVNKIIGIVAQGTARRKVQASFDSRCNSCGA